MRGFAVFVMMVVAFVAMPVMAIEPRIALVVGNTAYDGEPLERLPNATKDARLISDVLRQAGSR